ncbi:MULTISPECIES: DUF3618 domain-containing protein [Actinomadura]|uniref:DUF3618 domain-containing protein n=1 Tax=Actinomadura geliboluensis TaxID=882440 RepID=A0A5S4GHZ2_9ACTN|nr:MULTISPECIES: DUF3618 domain-containing protein [Actinomadura]TDB83158.1 DUF3618 domain-containing protein [Actinomadura sp. KC216]TMR32332.1 DUF3618 domain-containing protein [Actinomadura geliboluensis]
MADRARDPDALERELQLTRQSFARTIDELAARVNPKNVAQRGTERLKEEAGQVARAVGSVVRPAEKSDDEESGGIDKRLVAAGIGAAVTVTALILWNRRRKRR